MSIQFVLCNDIDCPLNHDKQCLAKWITVKKDGRCSVRDQLHEDKWPTENYVDMKECLNKSCDHWEMDEATEKGQCGFRENLFFKLRRVEDEKKRKMMIGPFCSEFERQIGQPDPFSNVTNVPERK